MDATQPLINAKEASHRMMTWSELLLFKTRLCPENTVIGHNRVNCLLLHDSGGETPLLLRPSFLPVVTEEGETRFRVLYSRASCHKSVGCPWGDHCKFTHNTKEALYHIAGYKRLQCKFGNSCKAHWCCFYHSKEEEDAATHLRALCIGDLVEKEPLSQNLPSQNLPSQNLPSQNPSLDIIVTDYVKPCDVVLPAPNFLEALKAMHAYNIAQTFRLFESELDGAALQFLLNDIARKCADEISLAGNEPAHKDLRREIALKHRQALEIMLNMLLEETLKTVSSVVDVTTKLTLLRNQIEPASAVRPFFELADFSGSGLHISVAHQAPDRKIILYLVERLIDALKCAGTLLEKK
jgi:hypothetical protein